MVTAKHSEGPSGKGAIKFLSGKVARGPEERARAREEHRAYEKRVRDKAKAEHDRTHHPTGLAEKKHPTGEISRPSGSRP